VTKGVSGPVNFSSFRGILDMMTNQKHPTSSEDEMRWGKVVADLRALTPYEISLRDQFEKAQAKFLEDQKTPMVSSDLRMPNLVGSDLMEPNLVGLKLV
jgi:hypothetical protein